MKFRAKTLTAIAFTLMASMALVASAPAAPISGIEKPKLKVGVGSKNGFFFLPALVADALGYFKDEGLNVEVVDLGSGGKALEALVGGSVDTICGAFDHVVQLRSKNVALQAYVLQSRLPDYAFGLVKSKAANYKSPEDLRGMRFGVSSPGSGSDMFLKLYLAKHGIKASDVPTVAVGLGPTAVAAVRSGQIDGIANNDPVLGILEQAGDIVIIGDGRTEKGSTEVYGGPYPTAAMVAYQDFINKNPKTIQALTNASVRALKWMSKATPEEIIKVMPPQFSQPDPEVTKKILANLQHTYSADGLFPDTSAQMAFDALGPYVPNIAAAKGQLDQTFTNTFVKAVGDASN
ncbi:NitT/TauT family transport system substrate-binding protein [Nitrobacteraceae bacterium AZCC 1564]